MKKATLIGIPLDLGAENLGVDVGPNAFRYQKLVEKLQSSGYEKSDKGFEITDWGNISCGDRDQLEMGNPKLRYLNEIVRVSEESAKLVFDLVSKGEKIIALGGDHSINLGVVSGASSALDGDLGMIYFDAHGDMHTEKTTISGNIHGMHLASLMGIGPHELVNLFKKGQKLKTQNLIHIGGSDFEQSETDLVKKEKIKCFMMFDLLSNGLKPVFELIDELKSRVEYIWVSLDLDCIDVNYAPGSGMPNKAGFTYREIMTMADYIGKSCNVVGVDMVEYNPIQDIEGKTAELGIELIAKFLGSNYSWYSNYMNQSKLK